MSDLNHFAISAIIGSEIAGRTNIGHGQLASFSGGQAYVDLLQRSGGSVSRDLASRRRTDLQAVIRAFLEVREMKGDRGSSDLYVADPIRNAQFIAKCREIGLSENEYALNKALFRARKSNTLKDLCSVKTRFNYEDYAFASEFAATEIKYETGATIDDILCHPVLAARLDKTARKLAPGYSSLEYRWALLAIRKAGRRAEWQSDYQMPSLTKGFRLVGDPIERLPAASGVYVLFERDKPLYARATSELRHGVQLHRRDQALSAIANPFWKPDLDHFTVSYATIDNRKMLRPVEKKLVQDLKPIFNIPRAAA